MARKKVETAVSEGHVLPRDISWMYFNRRILQEAMREEVRLLNDAVQPEVWERLATELALLTQGMTEISIIGSGGNINKLYRLAEKKDRKRQCFTVTPCVNSMRSCCRSPRRHAWINMRSNRIGRM